VFRPGCGSQCKRNSRNIDHAVNNACTDVYCCFAMDFHSSSPEIQAKKIDNIRSMICQRINSSCTDPPITQPHNDQGSFDEDFIDYVLDKLIEQPDNSFNSLSGIVAATEASIWVGLPSPAAVSLSPAATATAIAMILPVSHQQQP